MVEEARRIVMMIPEYWCEPETATSWLISTGWTINKRKRRARKSHLNVPAPKSGVFYDLHDVAMEEKVWASEIVKQIVEWSCGVQMAGKGRPPLAIQLRVTVWRKRMVQP